jgi:hypothetical protein
MTEQEQLIQAIENIRRDKKDPWRYILFTLLNGIAQGLGVALGMSLFLGIAIFILTKIIAAMVGVPVIGQYFEAIKQVVDASLKIRSHTPHAR